MALELYLLRHAIAVDRGTPGFDNDRLRPLTEEGREKMERIAAGMKAMGLKFDVILTSPHVRARETALIAATALRQKQRVRLDPSLQADQAPPGFMTRLAARHAGRSSILAVGHEPFLSSLATLLLGLPGGSAVVMKKGGLCKLTVSRLNPKPLARIEWLLTPKQLRMLA
jgi:phosphohistidine phosphatase